MAALSKEDRQAYLSARLAKLKNVLMLTPAQEKHWPATEAVMRDVAKARFLRGREIYKARAQQKKQKQPTDLGARLRDRAKGLRSQADRIEKFADAAKPLLDSLTPAQRTRMACTLQAARARRAAVRKWGKLVRHMKRQTATA